MEGLASDTRVRTTRGVLPLSEVKVGDYLYDAQDNPVMCTAVADFPPAELKRVSYRDFDSDEIVSFKCTPGYRVPMVSIGVKPYCWGNIVYWFTRCNRKNLGTTD